MKWHTYVSKLGNFCIVELNQSSAVSELVKTKSWFDIKIENNIQKKI